MASRGERVQAISRQLIGPDVVADLTGYRSVLQQTCDQAVELPLCKGDLIVAMQKRRQFGAVRLVSMVAGPLLVDVGIGLQDSLKPLLGIDCLVAHFGQMEKVS